MRIAKKLRLRLALIANYPEPVLLERLAQLSRRELRAFQHLFGIRECLAVSGRHAPCTPRQRKGVWSPCRCPASRQADPKVPWSAQQLLLALLRPADFKEPPADQVVSKAESTEAKADDFASRADQGLAIFNHGDFLQKDTFDDDNLSILGFQESRNGCRMRRGARVLGQVVRQAA